MSRRRRKGNPLLARIVVISVVVHVIALPILAHFGAFKAIQARLSRPEVVIMPPPPEKSRPNFAKKEQKQVHKAQGKGKAPKNAVAKNEAPHPSVVAAQGPGPANGDAATIDAGNSNIKPGTLPTGPAGKGPDKPVVTDSGNSTRTEAAPPPKPTVVPEPTPPKPHVPVVTEVAATYNPSPVIPDDLRTQAIDATVTAQFNVQTDGSLGEVKLVRSSGNDQLDRLALETARKWRFKPATRDGQPIESRVILHIEFEVQ